MEFTENHGDDCSIINKLNYCSGLISVKLRAIRVSVVSVTEILKHSDKLSSSTQKTPP